MSNDNESRVANYGRDGALHSLKFNCERGRTPDVINESGKSRKVMNGKIVETHDDTALIGAARNGHLEEVRYLLSMCADPTLESCSDSGVSRTAVGAACNALEQLKQLKEGISKEVSVVDVSPRNPHVAALNILYQMNLLKNVVDILQVIVIKLVLSCIGTLVY